MVRETSLVILPIKADGGTFPFGDVFPHQGGNPVVAVRPSVPREEIGPSDDRGQDQEEDEGDNRFIELEPDKMILLISKARATQTRQ